MRIVFSNRFYWPDEPATAQLLGDLAERLAANHEVTVVAGRPHSFAGPKEEVRHGVRIVRVWTSAGKGIVGKLGSFLTYTVFASIRLAAEVGRGDVLVCLTDPPLFGIVAAAICELKGARLVHWAQDIYPEIAATLSGRRSLMALALPRNSAWRQADACVTLGSDMAEVLRSGGVDDRRLIVLPNWAPQGLAPASEHATHALRAKWSLGSAFVIMYSGNLGRVHAIECVVELAAALRSRPDMAILMVGTGARRPALEAEANARGLSNLRFRPPQPREQLAETLSLGDLHLITLRADCARYVFPSKFYGILAVGRPIAFIGPVGCELARLIESKGLGRAFDPADIHALAAFAESLAADPSLRLRYAQASAAYAAEGGGAEAAAENWERVLAQTLNPPYCSANR